MECSGAPQGASEHELAARHRLPRALEVSGPKGLPPLTVSVDHIIE